MHNILKIRKTMDTNFIKYNSKEEAIAAFRKMKQRKKEWLEQTDREFKLIRDSANSKS